jgi:hypothetical protein
MGRPLHAAGPGDGFASGTASSLTFGTGRVSQIQYDFIWMSHQKFRAVHKISKKKYEELLAKSK